MKLRILFRTAFLCSCIITATHINAMEENTVEQKNIAEVTKKQKNHNVSKGALYTFLKNIDDTHLKKIDHTDPDLKMFPVIEGLLDNRAEINFKNTDDKNSPLYVAIKNEFISSHVVQYLLDKRANVYHPCRIDDKTKMLPLEYATTSGNVEKARVILNYMKRIKQNN